MVSIDFCKAFVGLHNGKVLKKVRKELVAEQNKTIYCTFIKNIEST